MSSEFPKGPPPDPNDKMRMTETERELRRVKAQQGGDPEAAFRAEMAEIEAAKVRAEKARQDYLRAQGKAEPHKVFHLLVSKQNDKFSVVGFYSTREALAGGLAAGITAYAEAGAVLGTVEFDATNIKLDQPPVAPL